MFGMSKLEKENKELRNKVQMAECSRDLWEREAVWLCEGLSKCQKELNKILQKQNHDRQYKYIFQTYYYSDVECGSYTADGDRYILKDVKLTNGAKFKSLSVSKQNTTFLTK